MIAGEHLGQLVVAALDAEIALLEHELHKLLAQAVLRVRAPGELVRKAEVNLAHARDRLLQIV